MLIYNFHPDSHEFTGATEADAAPWNPNEFLIPANATQTPPGNTVAEGHVLAWDSVAEEWREVEDHRGEIWWTATGESMTIHQIGNPLDYELVAEPPMPPLAPDVVKIRFALVHDGIVYQTLEADCPMRWQLAEGCRMVVDADDEARPGYSFDGKSFIPPPEPEPEPVTEPEAEAEPAG